MFLSVKIYSQKSQSTLHTSPCVVDVEAVASQMSSVVSLAAAVSNMYIIAICDTCLTFINLSATV